MTRDELADKLADGLFESIIDGQGSIQRKQFGAVYLSGNFSTYLLADYVMEILGVEPTTLTQEEFLELAEDDEHPYEADGYLAIDHGPPEKPGRPSTPSKSELIIDAQNEEWQFSRDRPFEGPYRIIDMTGCDDMEIDVMGPGGAHDIRSICWADLTADNLANIAMTPDQIIARRNLHMHRARIIKTQDIAASFTLRGAIEVKVGQLGPQTLPTLREWLDTRAEADVIGHLLDLARSK